MSAMASISVYDGASTPVLHEMKPMATKFDEKLGQMSLWREALTGIPVHANVKLTTLIKQLKGGAERIEIRFEVPVMETPGTGTSAGYLAAPKVAHTLQGSTVFYFDNRATIAERRLIRQMVVNAAGGVTGSTAASTASLMAETVDQSISAS